MRQFYQELLKRYAVTIERPEPVERKTAAGETK